MRETGTDNRADQDALDKALRSAFPTLELLDRMLYLKLGWNLADIVGRVGLLSAVPELLKHAESRGALGQLVAAAYRENSTNKLLKAFHANYFSLAAPSALEKIVREQSPSQRFAEVVERQRKILGQVCLVEIDGTAAGTGFLVGHSAVLTNYHVIVEHGQMISPRRIACRFDFTGSGTGMRQALSPTGMLTSSPWSAQDLVEERTDDPDPEELDFALLELAAPIGESRGHIEIPATAPSFPPDSALFIVQHPDGEPLTVAVDTQAILAVNGNGTRVRYRTNTLPGSSGSPCFDAGWNLVALHHAGDPKPDAKGNRFGRYNEGIPIHLIRNMIANRGMLSELGGPAPVPAPSRAPLNPPPNDGDRPVLESTQSAQPATGNQTQAANPPAAPASCPLKLVYHTASRDQRYGRELERHLTTLVKRGLIERPWNVTMIPPGFNRKEEIQKHFAGANLILLLVSADLLADGGEFLDLAEARHKAGALVVPIMVRPAGYQGFWFDGLGIYPSENDVVKPISRWSDESEAWLNVTDGLEASIRALSAG